MRDAEQFPGGSGGSLDLPPAADGALPALRTMAPAGYHEQYEGTSDRVHMASRGAIHGIVRAMFFGLPTRIGSGHDSQVHEE